MEQRHIGTFAALKATKCPLSPGLFPYQPHAGPSVPGGEENRELKVVPELPLAPGVTFLQAPVRPDCISEPPRGAAWK